MAHKKMSLKVKSHEGAEKRSEAAKKGKRKASRKRMSHK
jgi:hypothetical protein